MFKANVGKKIFKLILGIWKENLLMYKWCLFKCLIKSLIEIMIIWIKIEFYQEL